MIDIRDEFNRAIAKVIADKSAFLSAGKAETFERYKELAGEIRGLQKAVEIFKDVVKNHGESEDDE